MAFFMLVFLFSVLQVQVGLAGDPTEYLCSDSFCLDVKCTLPDVETCYNETLAILVPSPEKCSCCDSCLIFQNEGDACIAGSIGQSFPTQMCGKGLKCVNKVCTKMEPDVIDPLLAENNYKCKNGVCNCVVHSSEFTISIFGSFPESDLEKGELQCRCSILQYKARKQAIRFFPFDGIYQPFARCLPNGQFDPLQCHEGVCSCVDPQTGEYDETVERTQLLALGNGFECFDPVTYGHTKKYYRDCEAAVVVLQRARDLVEAEGFQFLFPYKLECEPDGTFRGSIPIEMRLRLQELESSVVKYSRFLG